MIKVEEGNVEMIGIQSDIASEIAKALNKFYEVTVKTNGKDSADRLVEAIVKTATMSEEERRGRVNEAKRETKTD